MTKPRFAPFALLTLTLTLGACQQAPQAGPPTAPAAQTPATNTRALPPVPPQGRAAKTPTRGAIAVLGQGHVHAEPGVQGQSLQGQTLADGLSYTAQAATVKDIRLGDQLLGRFLTQTITVTNTGSRSYSNLQLIAVNPGNVGGVALGNVTTEQGPVSSVTTARAFIPGQTPGGAPGQTSTNQSSFQLLTPQEAQDIKVQAVQAGLIPQTTDVLEYGFHGVRKTADSSETQQLAPGESVNVYLSYTLPPDLTGVSKADYSFVAAELPATRVSQARGEEMTAPLMRAYLYSYSAIAAEDTSPMNMYASMFTLINTPNPKFYTPDTVPGGDTPTDGPVEVKASVSNNPGIVHVGDNVTLDASGSTAPEGSTVLWTVSKANYSTGQYTPPVMTQGPLDENQYLNVTFDTPGVTSISQTIIAPDGQSRTTSYKVTVLAEDQLFAPATAQSGASVHLTLPIMPDLSGQNHEKPLQVSWEVDGQTLSGNDVQHTFTTPGFHDYTVTVRNPNQPLDENGQAPVVYVEQQRVNVRGNFFKPNLSYTPGHYNTPNDGLVNFTATAGEYAAADEQFHWDFGDGTTSSARTPQHQYTQPGRYVVTLKVTHPDGTSDEDSNVVIYNESEQPFFTFRDHVVGPQSVTTRGLQAQNVSGLRSTTIESPYLVPAGQSSVSMGVMANFGAPGQNLQDIQISVDGQTIPEGQGWKADQWYTETYPDKTTQRYLTSLSIDKLPLPARSGKHALSVQAKFTKTLPFYEPLGTASMTVNTLSYAGLRVPKVIMNFLPESVVEDQQLGTQTYTQDGEMVSVVNIAEQKDQDTYTIELPIYMVDEQGAVMQDASGFTLVTNADRSATLHNNVFVHGKGKLNISVTRQQLEDPNFTLDLTQLNVGTDYGIYQFKESDDNYTRLSGQVTLPVSAQTPQVSSGPSLSIQSLKGESLQAQQLRALGIVDWFREFKMPLPKDFRQRLGKVWSGRSEAARRSIQNALKNYDGSVVSIAVSFVPVVGDGIELVKQGYSFASGKGVDKVETALAIIGMGMDLTTGVGDFTSPIKAVYKGGKWVEKTTRSPVTREAITQMVEEVINMPSGTTLTTAMSRMKDTGQLLWDLKGSLTNGGLLVLNDSLTLAKQAKGTSLAGLDALNRSYASVKGLFNTNLDDLSKLKIAKYGIWAKEAAKTIAQCGPICKRPIAIVEKYYKSPEQLNDFESLYKDINVSSELESEVRLSRTTTAACFRGMIPKLKALAGVQVYCDDIDIAHIFQGNERKAGFHYESSMANGLARVAGTRKFSLAGNGVYRADVEIYNTASKTWVRKKDPSDFFPQHWIPQEVYDEILSAFTSPGVQRIGTRLYQGIGQKGLKVIIVLDHTGSKIVSAWPVGNYLP